MYKKVEVNGKEYKHMGVVHGYVIYVNAAWPDSTEQRFVDFLEEKGREWIQDNISYGQRKGFRRADPATDSNFYYMRHPEKAIEPSGSRQMELLVDRH